MEYEELNAKFKGAFSIYLMEKDVTRQQPKAEEGQIQMAEGAAFNTEEA